MLTLVWIVSIQMHDVPTDYFFELYTFKGIKLVHKLEISIYPTCTCTCSSEYTEMQVFLVKCKDMLVILNWHVFQSSFGYIALW